MDDLTKIRITKIESVMTVKNEKGINRIMTDRFAFGLGFCRYGKLTYVHKTERFVSDRSVAVIIPKGKSYSFHCDETGEFPLVNFQCEGFDPSSFIAIPISDPNMYLSVFDEDASVLATDGNDLAKLSAVYKLLAMLSSESADEKVVGAIRPAVEYIAQNYCSPELDCAFLARLCFMSEAYFRRLFGAGFGTSPAKYIKDLRVRKAKNMLATSEDSVTEVAEKCGYSSVYYFCQDFKTITGETPTGYRRRWSERSY